MRSFPLDCAHGDLRLVGGETESEGRVEVCYKGGWYSVCGMDEQEASIMCKQLGHTEYPRKQHKETPLTPYFKQCISYQGA